MECKKVVKSSVEKTCSESEQFFFFFLKSKGDLIIHRYARIKKPIPFLARKRINVQLQETYIYTAKLTAYCVGLKRVKKNKIKY
jgi:hypothetical protein